MPEKSRRRRGKHPIQNKRKKGGPSYPTTLAQPSAVAQTSKPIPPPDRPAPPASVPTPIAKPAAVRYPYIKTELLVIGILAGTMLTVLIVLALVLP